MIHYKKFATELVKKSGEVIKLYFRQPFSVETKEDESPVTVADKKAEEVMREWIMKEFSEHGIVGEEFGNYNPDAEYVWVLDPIDGTKNFICGGLAFGTLVALLKNGQPVLGIIYQPILDELLVGDNEQASLNEHKVRVRYCTKIKHAVMLTSDPYLFEKYQNKQGFDRLRKKVRLFRSWGDCYGYFLLSLGCIDIMVDPIMNFWDIPALIPVIRGAGGRITDMQGGEAMQGNSIVATAGNIHDEVINILNGYVRN